MKREIDACPALLGFGILLLSTEEFGEEVFLTRVRPSSIGRAPVKNHSRCDVKRLSVR